MSNQRDHRDDERRSGAAGCWHDWMDRGSPDDRWQECYLCGEQRATLDERRSGAESAPNIADTCCGQCPGGTCYVDQVTGA